MRRIALLSITSCLALMVAGAQTAHGGSFRGLWERADEAAQSGDHERADKLYQKARRKAPDNAYLAFDHAALLAEAGEIDAAFAALDAALVHEYRHEERLLESAALEPLHELRGWEPLLERARANQAAYKARREDARTPIDPADAEAFDDLASLLEAMEEAQRDLYSQEGEPWQIKNARYAERWAAALKRLAATTEPGSTEREEILIEIVRLRVEKAESLRLSWEQDSKTKVSKAAEEYLGEYPVSEGAVEARLALTVARTAAPWPEDFRLPKASWPRPTCEETLSVFERLGAVEPPDRWSLSARGFEALCLVEIAPDRGEEIRAAADSYLDSEETEWSTYDMMLRAELKIALWRLDGPPAFEAEALAGDSLSLEDLKGQVTLLDFWNPG